MNLFQYNVLGEVRVMVGAVSDAVGMRRKSRPQAELEKGGVAKCAGGFPKCSRSNSNKR